MSNITLTIPNDDHIALRAFGKALEEMALAHGAPLRVNPHVTVEKLREAMNNAEPTCFIPETDTTSQQVESKDDYRKWYEEAIEASNEAGYTCMSAADVIKNMAGYISTLENYGSAMYKKAESYSIDTTAQQVESLVERVDTMLEVAEQPFQGESVPTTDSTGTPWDERIHSTSKALNVDGTWRLRRKPKDMDEAQWTAFVEGIKACYEVDNSPVQQVEQPFTCEQQPINLDHVSIDPVHETVELTVKPPVTPPGDDFHADADVVTEQTVAGIPPLPVPPPVVVAPPVPEVTTWDFPRLMTFLTERHGKIDVATVNTLLAQDDMSSVQELNAHPDKIGPFVARVKAHLGE